MKNVLLIIAGVCIGVVLKLFVLDVLVVSGTSMEPALHEGQMIPVAKLAYGVAQPFGDRLLLRWSVPKRGDIVIYLYDNKPVVKRCVALAGDALEYANDSGYSVRVPALPPVPLTEHQYQRLKHSAAVPVGMIFAVGDNAMESIDSRNYGFIPVDNILGKVLRQNHRADGALNAGVTGRQP